MAAATGDTRTPHRELKGTALTMALAGAAAQYAHAQGTGVIKIGLLGCGGRGNGALRQCLAADPGVEVIALADLFEHKVRSTRDRIAGDKKHKARVKIPDENLFWGYDCHVKLAQCDADLLLMATPPAFRGYQILAAIRAGKHIFTEKPVASDPFGCKQIMEASRIAKEKGLAIVCGTQRRHEFGRVELMKRIHDGALGELAGGQCYWLGGGIWYRGYSDGMTELDWQCNNWYHFTWLSGDQICEQHIHNIDVLNWCFQGHPVKISAVGGRACRDYSRQARAVCRALNNGSEQGWEKYNGDIWDHLFAEFEYANGARCLSMSGHGPGSGRNGEKIVGTKGVSDCRGRIWGENEWSYKGKHVNGQQQEHVDLIASIRKGEPLNEGQRIAESTLTAIGARMAGYTGNSYTWDELLNSALRLVPDPATLKPGPGTFYPVPTGHDPVV